VLVANELHKHDLVILIQAFIVPCLKNLEKSKCSQEETKKPSIVANFR